MVRMKYKKRDDSTLLSQEVIAGNKTYRVVIAYDGKTEWAAYAIAQEDTKVGNFIGCKNVLEAKRKAKRELKKLGAVFYDEVRRRDK